MPPVVLLVLPAFVFALALPPVPRRDILGLIAGDSDAPSPSHTARPVSPNLTLTLTIKPSTTPAASPSAAPSPSTSRPSARQSWSPAPSPRTDSAAPTAVKTALASTPTPTAPPASAESRATDLSSKTWQIVGIAIIAVLFIATSIACAMFFDRLWRFLKDAICCTSRRPPVFEEFIPDCEKHAWGTGTLSPSPSNLRHCKPESLPEDASVHTTRARELPWNADATLHRQPSRRNDHPPLAA